MPGGSDRRDGRGEDASAEVPLDARLASQHGDETEAERGDRNLAELLQELRVAGLGVQVLFGFLLSLPFTSRFDGLSGGERGLYIVSLLLAASATALLSAPVAFHRLVFRRGQRARLLSFSNGMAICGLVAVGLAVSTAVWLALSESEPHTPLPLLALVSAASFVVLWFAVPLSSRVRTGYPTHQHGRTS